MDRPVPQFSDGPVLQLCVTAQFYLESKGKYILEAWGAADPKDVKRREAPCPILAPLFIWFFPPPPGLAGTAVYFTWGPHSGRRTFLCSIYTGFSLPCLLATTILDSFFLFYLTAWSGPLPSGWSPSRLASHQVPFNSSSIHWAALPNSLCLRTLPGTSPSPFLSPHYPTWSIPEKRKIKLLGNNFQIPPPRRTPAPINWFIPHLFIVISLDRSSISCWK